MAVRDWRAGLRFGLPGLILGLALAWGMAGGKGLLAQGTTPSGSERPRVAAPGEPQVNAGLMAFTTPIAGSQSSAHLLYLIDTKTQTFAIYRVDPSTNSTKVVKLEATREYRWDLRLSEYNNAGFTPEEIKTAVQSSRSSATR